MGAACVHGVRFGHAEHARPVSGILGLDGTRDISSARFWQASGTARRAPDLIARLNSSDAVCVLQMCRGKGITADSGGLG
jgi:hypothetical protein